MGFGEVYYEGPLSNHLLTVNLTLYDGKNQPECNEVWENSTKKNWDSQICVGKVI